MVRLLDRLGLKRRSDDIALRLIVEADAANRARDWERAADFYRRALDLDPSRAGIHVQLGHSLKEQGYLGRAVQSYRRAIAIEPRNADTHLQLGHALKLRGLMGEAARAYAAAKSLDPSSPDIEREYAETTRHRTAAPPLARHGAAWVEEDVSAILEEADLGQPFVDVFDVRFYFFAHLELAAAGRGADPALCLRHFCDVGLPGLSPIAPDCAFDLDFYVSTYVRDRAMQPLAAYRHWLTIGLWRGWAPNRTRLARMLFGDGVPPGLPDNVLRLAAEAQDRSAWTALYDRLAASGEGKAAAETATVRAAFESLAVRLTRGDAESRDEGFALAQRLMGGEPSRAIRLAYADGLMGRGCLLEAAAMYRNEVAGGDASAWVFAGLCDCLDGLGRWTEALEAAARGQRLHPGDPGLRDRTDDLARRVIDRSWTVALASGQDDIAAAREALERTLAGVVALTRTRARLPARPIRRIAIVGNQGIDQCRFYRIDQKLEQLAQAGFEAELFDHQTGLDAFMGRAQTFDAAIFYRVAAFYPVIQAIGLANELGLVTFYDIDDLIFDPAHYPPSLASFGGLIGAEEHLGLVMGMPLYAAAMRLCDVGLASTPTLASAMAPLVSTGRVFLHRNAFGSLHEAAARHPVRRPDGDKVTFFYASGTKAHKEDFQRLAEPALQALVRRHGDRVSIVLAGHVATSPALESIKHNLVRLDMMPLAALWQVLSRVDVNLAVLLPGVMADAKSEIKWMEAAMLGVPTVASDTATYREVIDPGVTGFLCGSADAWCATLDRLFNDADLRRRVGDSARAQVLARYGLAAAAGNLADTMRQAGPAPAARPRRKILVVNVYYPPAAIGGATRVVHDNVRDLSIRYGADFDVEVFTTAGGAGEPYRTSSYGWQGVRVTGVTVPDPPMADDPDMGEVFAQFLGRSRPDLVHFHCVQQLTVAVVEAARRLQIPYLITAHDGWWISGEQFLVNRALEVERYAFDDPARTARELGAVDHARMERLRPALGGAVKVLAVSEAFARLYRDCGVPNVAAIPNGVSDAFRPKPRSPRSGKVRLGFFGGLEAHKGSVLIRTALASAPFEHLSLLVVDHEMPPDGRRCELWGQTPVEIVPKRPQGEAADLYADTDVLLAPSICPESFGLVTREALLAGCWVVASDRGSIGEDVVEGLNGFLVDVSTMLPLRDVLSRIDRDPARYRKPPDTVARLRTSSEQADDLARLYRSILTASAP